MQVLKFEEPNIPVKPKSLVNKLYKEMTPDIMSILSYC